MDKNQELNLKLDQILANQKELFIYLALGTTVILQHLALFTGYVFYSFIYGFIGFILFIYLFKNFALNKKIIFNTYFKIVEREVKK